LQLKDQSIKRADGVVAALERKLYSAFTRNDELLPNLQASTLKKSVKVSYYWKT
jgi:hypothetical protein